MTGSEHVFAEESGPSHPLRRGATPATIHARLLAEDRDAFVAAYQQALDETRHSLDLTVVHDVVEHWRRRAVLQTDPEGYRETVRRVAELATGAPSPADEPFEITRDKAGL